MWINTRNMWNKCGKHVENYLEMHQYIYIIFAIQKTYVAKSLKMYVIFSYITNL